MSHDQDHFETIDTVVAQLWGKDVPSSSEEVFESSEYDIYKKHEIEQNKKFANKEVEGSAGICPNCGSDMTASVPLQTRCADEAISFKVQCAKCKHQWHGK